MRASARGLSKGLGRAVGSITTVAVLVTGMALPSAAEAQGCTVTGTAGDDVLVGTAGPDVLCGLGGDDRLDGGGGDDRLEGGAGNDRLVGGDGADTLVGDAGDDLLIGGDGNDVLRGGNGNDRLVGSVGDDDLAGENGTDELAGGAGSDVVDGGNGPDRLLGGSGSDRLFGGDGPDLLWAGTGDDALDGGHAPDECFGADGTNTYVACESQSDTPAPGTEDDTDLDADGLPDELEFVAGTDLLSSDTDGDGIPDGAEYDTATDPTLRDSDGDGVDDSREDVDGDGLAALDELGRGTNPLRTDTDADTLSDGSEVAAGTDPSLPDTDGDGLTDAQEPALGTVATDSDTDGDGILDGAENFDRTVADDVTGAVFTAHGLGGAVLAVELKEPLDERLTAVPGQRGPPIDVVVPEPIVSGTLTLRFDPATMTPGAELAILHFDEETGVFDVPAVQTVDLAAGTASVTTDDFSPFVLVEVGQFAEVWASEITVPRTGGGGAGQPIDAAVVLDSSGSMTWNDPRGARRLAGKAFVDALLEGDKVAVVDFDSWATVLQALTDDFEAAKAAIDRVNSSGGTNIGAGLRAALDHLDAMGAEGRGRVVVLLTDGIGAYDQSLTARAAASGTTVYTVGLGRSVPVALLTSIAEGTGGRYFQVDNADDLIDTFERIGGDLGAPDTDGDGVADATEEAGARDGTGAIYYTDPTNPDTDGDGLTDGDELGAVLGSGPYGTGSYFEAKSAPTRADSDSDGLDDWYEVANISMPRAADYDRDGLNDLQELESGTHPFSNDTDTDGFTDDWELARLDKGYHPSVYDETYEWWEYAGDFARGALCGDATGVWGFCDGDTVPFLVGSITAGVVVIGDIRDALANIAQGDALGVGLSLVGIIPAIGDAASVVTKAVKFMKRISLGKASAVTRHIAHAGYIPTWAKTQILDLASGGSITAIRAMNKGIGDDILLGFARRGISPQHLRRMLDNAAQVNPAVGRFYKEAAAENVLRQTMPRALPGRPGRALEPGGPRNLRYPDIIDPSILKGFEVKHGYIDEASRAGIQVNKDAQMVSSRANPDIETMQWDFFADRHGLVGPDEFLLQDLIDKGIPFVIHLP